MTARTSSPFLWLYGPSGVGKSTVGWEVFRLLGAAGLNSAFVDADQLGLCYPAFEDDPDNHRLKAANLAAAWQAYRAAGAEYLILSGYVANAEEVRLYAEAVPGTALTLCRLRASRAVLEERFLRRGWLVQYVAQTLEEADVLDGSELTGAVVETDGLSAERIAQQICGSAGVWPVISSDRTSSSNV
jgi:cytidylate kinase